jgi:flagellar hook-length control protein FliK
LTLPRLGEVDVQIKLQGQEITLALTTGSANTQSLLRNAAEALRSQLGEAGLALSSLGVTPAKESP